MHLISLIAHKPPLVIDLPMICQSKFDVPTKAKIEEIVETMIEDGHNAREIGAEVPMSRTTIWRRLHRYSARQQRFQKEQEEKKKKRQ